MRYIWQHIQSVIEAYNGSVPLTHFLRNYYKQYPKLGSRDRKILSEMAYCWYRCSKGFEDAVPFEDKLKACLYLCETENKHSLQFLPDAWIATKQDAIDSKVDILEAAGYPFHINGIADFDVEVSEGITKDIWQRSMLIQPLLFIRIRKEEDKALSLLEKSNIEYNQNGKCIGIKNGTAIEKVLPPDWYVVQDASSQQTGNYFNPMPNEKWWDCCSGAGGKSLLLTDIEPAVRLTVSDKRASILHNLSARFKQYGHKMPQQVVLDTANTDAVKHALANTRFDHIICDVPCTGSGTWARTPEQLYYYDIESTKQIATLQASIAINAAVYLKPGGTMFYITCSIFKEENEHVVHNIVSQTGIQLKEMGIVNGVEGKADSMFIASLQKD
jgi:16S rRNA (cytosine967-C5)-methyltransferase